MIKFLTNLILLAVLVIPAMTVAAVCPDLVPQGLTLFGTENVYPGELVGPRLMAFVRNLGDSTAGQYSVAFYISSDSSITLDDQLLNSGRDFYDSLATLCIEPLPLCASLPGGCTYVSIPSGFPSGPAYIGVLVDEFESITECDESNNFMSIPVTVASPANSTLEVPSPYATITAAMTAASSGDTILIAAGEYDEAFTVSKNLIFIGAGSGSTILRTTTIDTALMAVDSGVSITVEDLQFSGWGSQPYWVRRGITGNHVQVQVNNVKFMNMGNFGVHLYQSRASLDSVLFFNQGTGADAGFFVMGSIFAIRNSQGGPMIDHIVDPSQGSIGIVEDMVIQGHTIYWANGVRVRDGGSAVLVRNNIMTGQHDSNTQVFAGAGGLVAFGPCFVQAHNNEIRGFSYGFNFGSGSTVKAYDNIVAEHVIAGVRISAQPSPYPDLGGGALNSPGRNRFHSNGDYNFVSEYTGAVYAQKNHWNLSDSAAIDSTIYDDDENGTIGEIIFMPIAYNTLIGWDVVFSLFKYFRLIFNEITSDGITTVRVSDPGIELPSTMIRVSPYYELETTAGYNGNIQIEMLYSEADIIGSETELKLMHYTVGEWTEITTEIDMNTDMIYGLTSTLSPFVIAESLSCCGQYTSGFTGNTNCDSGGLKDLADITRLIDNVYISKTALCCTENGNVNGDAGGLINLADITKLIDHVYISKEETAECE